MANTKVAAPKWRPAFDGMIDGSRMRSLADAIFALEQRGAPQDRPALIYATPLALPDGRITYLVSVAASPDPPPSWVVALPCCRAFTHTGSPEQHKPGRFKESTDWLGNVRLRDGTPIRGVQFLPERMQTKLSDDELRIVVHALRKSKQLNRCLRYLTYWGWYLDYAEIQKVSLPSLKAIHRNFSDREGPSFSVDAVRRALAKAGMRRPRSGIRSARSLANFTSQSVA